MLITQSYRSNTSRINTYRNGHDFDNELRRYLPGCLIEGSFWYQSGLSVSMTFSFFENTLLYGKNRSKKGQNVLYRKEKIKNALRYLYAAMMCILLLEFLLEIAVFDESGRIPHWIWAARCAAGFLGIWLSKNWKKATFQLLAVFSSLILLRALIRQGNYFLEYKAIAKAMLYFIWVWGGCFAFGTVLENDKIKSFLIIFGAVWTIGMTVYALYGLNAAWMEVRIPNLSGKGFFKLWGEADHARLKLVYLSTISGQLMAMSIIIAFVCMLCVQKKGLKCLFCLSVFPMLIALALTDSRNAQICVSAGMSILAGIVILDREQKRLPTSTGLRPKRIRIVSLAGMAATFVFTLFLFQIINPAFDQLKKSSVYWPFLQSGANNTEKQIVLSNRGFLNDDFLTGRTEIWRATLTFLIGNPKYLLVGKSIINPMEAVNACHLARGIATTSYCRLFWKQEFQVCLYYALPFSRSESLPSELLPTRRHRFGNALFLR